MTERRKNLKDPIKVFHESVKKNYEALRGLGPVNKTECGMVIERIALPRGQIHRDYIAHCLRWSYVLKQVKIGMNIIDVGCGSFPLLKALYSNKLKPSLYVGVDIRRSVIE